jgi:hypothetical protein
MEQIMEALQDEGKKEEKRWTFPKINKLAQVIFKNINQHFNDSGLGQNAARDSAPLSNAIILCRNQAGTTTANPMYQPFAKGRREMSILTSVEVGSVGRCGLERPIVQFRKEIEQKKKKGKVNRTSDDGLRLSFDNAST